MISFSINYLLKGPFSLKVTLGFRASTYEGWARITQLSSLESLKEISQSVDGAETRGAAADGNCLSFSFSPNFLGCFSVGSL